MTFECLEQRALLAIANGSFETGDLSKWTALLPTAGSATVVPSQHTINYVDNIDGQTKSLQTYSAVDGSSFALLETGLSGSYPRLSQSFTAAAGDKISGESFFASSAFGASGDVGPEEARVQIKDGAEIIATVYYASRNALNFFPPTAENWKHWEYQFSKADVYTIEASFTHLRGTSWLGLDAVRLIDRPLPVVSDNFATTEGMALTVPAPGVLANDINAEADQLTATKVSPPSHGDLTLNPDGSFRYSPAPHYVGQDSFTYRASAGKMDLGVATVTIDIWPVPRRVADINTAAPGVVLQSSILDVEGIGFFAGDDGISGAELWRSNGKSAGTSIVREIFPGASGSYPRDFIRINDTLFFTADDGIHGRELWKSDGTYSGTMLVKDINASLGQGSNPSNLVNVNGTLFFQADDGINGIELWKTTGTDTTLVKDINTNGNSRPSDLVNVNGTLFFRANDGVTGDELWKSDGTAKGTLQVRDINTAGGAGSRPAYLTSVNGILFFVADDGIAGAELWKSDGTEPNTTLVKDINSAGSSNPLDLTVVNGTLFFSASDGASGRELWKSSGTDTEIVRDINTGPLDSNPLFLTSYNGALYFTANNVTNGTELWKSDGTAAETKIVVDIAAGEQDSFPRALTQVDGTLFFTANDGLSGTELWKTNGDATGTELVKDIHTGITGSYPTLLASVNGILFFTPPGDASYVTSGQLWTSDGTANGTSRLTLESSANESSSPSAIEIMNGIAYFVANDETNGVELWRTDGTTNGTWMVKDVFPGPGSSYPSHLTNVNGTLFFHANNGTEGDELWKSDGTSEGTKIVKDIVAGAVGSAPSDFTVSNGTLFFVVNDSVHGAELWKSDGSVAGTDIVKDIRPGTLGSEPRDLTNVNGTLFFSADDGAKGRELWKSNGTAQDTVLVKDIFPGLGAGTDSNPSHLANINGTLFFAANDGNHGIELWKSNGTLGTTLLVKDIVPGIIDSNITDLTNVDGTLFGISGNSLVKSDGTADGTSFVEQHAGLLNYKPRDLTAVGGKLFFVFGPTSVGSWILAATDGISLPLIAFFSGPVDELADVNGTLLFSTYDGVNGQEVWTSDTALNLRRVGDIAAGPQSSFPADFEAFSGGVLFSAFDIDDGRELWSLGLANQPNQSPVASSDNFSTPINTPLNIAAAGVLLNDSDPDGNQLTAIAFTNPSHGTLAPNASGSFIYTPANNYTGPDTFTYKASDGQLTSNIATVNLTVTAVNGPPVASNDNYSTPMNTPLSVATPGVLVNDNDPDGNQLTAIAFTNPSHGTLAPNASGSFIYTPANNYTGPDSFTYKASDGQLTSIIATVNLTVTAVNRPPVASSDNFTTPINTPLNIAAAGVLLNDSDPDGNQLTAIAFTNPSHGTLAPNASGSFIYTPANNYTGPDSFTYKASDGQLTSNIATVNLTVTAVNRPPVASSDNFSTPINTPLIVTASGVLLNDSDPDGNQLTAIAFTNPSHGTLAPNASGSFIYTPANNYTGADGFTYKASDGQLTSNIATVNLTVTAVNRPPVASNDNFSTPINTPLNIAASGVLLNDNDADGNQLAAIEFTNPSHGTLASNASGSFIYTPANNYTGPDTFTYKASDGQLTSNIATVNLTVTAVNQPSLASVSGHVYADLNGSRNYNPASDDAIPGLTVTLTQGGTELHRTTTDTKGAFAFNTLPAGTYSLIVRPEPALIDGVVSSKTIVITAEEVVSDCNPHVPWLRPQFVSPRLFLDSAQFGTTRRFELLQELITLAKVRNSPLPTWTAVPEDCLDIGSPSNRPPIAVDDVYTGADEDTVFMVNLVAQGLRDKPNSIGERDHDPDGHPLTIAEQTITSARGALVTLKADGTFTYDPTDVNAIQTLPAGELLEDTFNYTLRDAQGATDTGTVTVTVAGRNDAPVLTPTNASETVIAGEPIEGVVGDFFNLEDIPESPRISDIDRDAVIGGVALIGINAQGTTEFSLNGTTFQSIDKSTVSPSSALLIPHDAIVRYTPAHEEIATFTYRAWDGTSGVAGGRANASNGGGTTAFSSSQDIGAVISENDFVAEGVTDSAGAIVLSLNGRSLAFDFLDQATGEPLSNVTVAVAQSSEIEGIALLTVIDPKEQYPVDVIMLQGAPGATIIQSRDYPESIAAQDEHVEKDVVRIGRDAVTRSIGHILTKQLPPAGQSLVMQTLQLSRLFRLTFKVVNQLGLKVGPTLDRFDLSVQKTTYLSVNEALDQIKSAKNDKLITRAFVFALTGGQFGLGWAGLLIDVASHELDKVAVSSCGGLPGIGVRRDTIGPFDAYTCSPISLSDQLASMGLLSVNFATEADVSGGSLDLVSTTDFPIVLTIPTQSAGTRIPVPVDDYEGVVRIPDFKPIKLGVSVPLEGVSVDIPLQPEFSTIPLSEIVIVPPAQDPAPHTFEDQSQPGATFDVNLKNRPDRTVWLAFDVNRSSEGRIVEGSVLAFTRDNYFVPKPVTVKGVDDQVIDGSQVYWLRVNNENIFPLFNVDNDGEIWRGTQEGSIGREDLSGDLEFNLIQNGTDLSGTVTLNGSVEPIDRGTIIGNQVVIEFAAGTFDWKYIGAITGDKMKGTFTVVNNADRASANGTFDVTKVSLIVAAAASNLSVFGEEALAQLTDAHLQPVVDVAIAHWKASGVNGKFWEAICDLDFQITELSDHELGSVGGGVVYLDKDAAGFGWFIDPTPWDNVEFTARTDQIARSVPESPAANKMDLLTVIAHEMGHLLGFADLDPLDHPAHLMASSLEPGLRRLPSPSAVDALFASDEWRGR